MSRLTYDWSFSHKKRRVPYLTSGDFIHPLNVNLLKNYVDATGRIKHRFFTGNTHKQQGKIAKAIKQARQLGLLPVKSY